MEVALGWEKRKFKSRGNQMHIEDYSEGKFKSEMLND